MPTDSGLRAEVEDAVLAELARVGRVALDKAAIVKRFADRGASRATLYRWVEGPLASGEGGQHVARSIRQAAEARAREPDPPAAVAAAAEATLPVVVRPDDIASSGTIAVIDRLVRCIEVAEQVIQYARNPDGTVRSARMLLAASDHMRRNLETANRLQESLRQVAEMDRFHRAIVGVVEEVAREHPEIGELIVTRLAALAGQWGG